MFECPFSGRLAVVKKYVATAQGMQKYAQTRVGQALSDWKSLPAVQLLPDVQVIICQFNSPPFLPSKALVQNVCSAQLACFSTISPSDFYTLAVRGPQCCGMAVGGASSAC